MAHIRDVWYFIKRMFSPLEQPKTAVVKVTCYGWKDNDPPGHSIAYPADPKDRAGGIGSFDDPVTFAANPRVFPKHTKIYIPRLKKYFIMKDLCGSAMVRKPGEVPIVDIWIGGTAQSDTKKLIQAEEDLTRELETIVVNATNIFPWDPTPLYED